MTSRAPEVIIKDLRDLAGRIQGLRKGDKTAPTAKAVEDLLREAANAIEALDAEVSHLELLATELEEGKDL